MNLLELVYILVKRRRFIIRTTLGVALVSFLIMLFMPKWYKATAVVLLPEKSASPLDFLTSSTGINLSTFGLGSITNAQRYIAILDSRRLKEEVINRFKLLEVYDLKYMDQAVKKLDSDLSVEINTKQGSIEIELMFRDNPDSAALAVNFIVDQLDMINRQLSTEQARSTRIFIEGQYHRARKQLAASEDSLNVFQKKYGVVSLTEQTKASIEAAAELYAKLVANETEYNVLRKNLGANHPEVLRLEAMIGELRKSQGRLDTGDSDFKILIPFRNSADLGLLYLRYYREVLINTKILEFLTPQFEQAKIQEAKDTPTLLVLDRGTPPYRHDQPKKATYTILIGLVVMMACGFIAVLKEKAIRMTSDDSVAEQSRFIVESLRPRNLFK